MVLCEPKATLTVGVPFIFGFPSPYSLNKCVLGMEVARVRKNTGPCPRELKGCRSQALPGLTIRQRRE